VAAIQQVFGAVALEEAVGGLIATVKEGDSIAINGHKRLLLLKCPRTRSRAGARPRSRRPATRAACWPSTTQMSSACASAVTD
jgi:dihydroxyacid dehydratase/phosphogluconate dehydratase